MRSLFCIVFLVLTSLLIISAGNRTDSLLLQLDHTIKERQSYGKEKEARIESLKELLRHTTSDEQRYGIYDRLFSEYHSYNTDSSMHVARERLFVAERLNKAEMRFDAQINMAEIMGTTGMYKEALELLKPIEARNLSGSLLSYYYHAHRTLYGLMADYAVTSQQKAEYMRTTDLYRDSLMLANPPASLTYRLVQADKLNIGGQYDEAIRLMADYYEENQEDEHLNAVVTYTLSESYRLKGDKEKEKEYLVLSSIADLKSAVKEYISLRKLAVLLYQEGNIDRAYKYLKCCMEDAILCNARLRLLEIVEIFPLVNQSYQANVDKQQDLMRTSLILISILFICLLLAVFYVYRQMKRLTVARREVGEVNKRLQELNAELHQSNSRLQESNQALTETSNIKEEYIGRYMDLCSIYLDKIEAYRRSLGKIAASGKVDELYKAIKSSRFVEDELKEFYTGFDETFLRLFPGFVDQFNDLLVESERILLKPGERLNTELRIFALIRLGITDSTKIAQFLRYSVTTIYNYRTKTRNKAAGERDGFEKKVMAIGNMGV